MIEYYELFGDKFCCVEDLTIYTDLLSEQEGQQVKCLHQIVLEFWVVELCLEKIKWKHLLGLYVITYFMLDKMLDKLTFEFSLPFYNFDISALLY